MLLLVIIDEPDDAHPAQSARRGHPRDDRAGVPGAVDQRRRRAPGGHDPVAALERRPHEDPRARREGEEHEGLQQEERTREGARARGIEPVEDQERHDHDRGAHHHGPDEIQQVPDRRVAPLAPMQPEGDVDERPDRERQQGGGEIRQDRDREVGCIEADAEHDDGRSERGDDIEHEQQPARPVEPPARPEGGRTVRSAHLRPHPASRLARWDVPGAHGTSPPSKTTSSRRDHRAHRADRLGPWYFRTPGQVTDGPAA